MGGWILRRLALGLFVIAAASLIVFLATQALPGDAAQVILGQRATPERLHALRDELGLDKSLLSQYVDWIGGVVHGDFGSSLLSGNSVGGLLGERLANTAILFVLAALISIPLSITLGAWAASRRDGPLDHGVMSVSMVLNSVPEFVIGILLVVLFSTTVLTILPGVLVPAEGQSPLARPLDLVLPVATLVLAISPYLIRLVRGSVIDALESEYVVMARLKGVPERRLLLRHALPNALLPTIQASAYVLTYLLGGLVVVEFLFNYPGLGRTLTDAVTNRDVPVVQGVVLVVATGVVLFNLLADLLTVLASPRLRTRAGAR